jgi:hypothetical protein
MNLPHSGVLVRTEKWPNRGSMTQQRLPEAVTAMGLDITAQYLDEVPRAAGVDRASFLSAPLDLSIGPP